MIARATLLLAILPGLALSAVPALRGAVDANLQSLRFGWGMQNIGQPAAACQALPTSHPRAAYWSALCAVQDSDGQAALRLLQPQAGEGDWLVLETMAGVHASLGDFPAAVRVWQQIGSQAALQRVGGQATEAGDRGAAQDAYTAAWRLNPEGKSTSTLANFL
jgi:hypothetical protein